ncbi:MAG: hypothetical protein Q8900_12335 [Bacillota bacterium]|nr:hypothetical protein [Bacillota bacterium]
MEKVLILGHAKPFNFQTDGGDRLTGVKVSYINAYTSLKAGEEGHTPLQLTLNPLVLQQMVEFPAIYEVEYSMIPGKNNKPEPTISRFQFVKKVDLSSLFKA